LNIEAYSIAYKLFLHCKNFTMQAASKGVINIFLKLFCRFNAKDIVRKYTSSFQFQLSCPPFKVRCGENRYLYPFLIQSEKNCDGLNNILRFLTSDFNCYGEKRVIMPMAVVFKSKIYRINRKCNKQAMFLL